MGGGIAMLYALEHPRDVTACILVGTGARLRVAGQTLQAAKNNYELFCDAAPGRAFPVSSPQGLGMRLKRVF